VLLGHDHASAQMEDFDYGVTIMKNHVFLAAAVIALIASGSSRADFLDVDWILGPDQHPDGQHTTFRIIARFSDPNDRISAVSCGMGIDLIFTTSDGSDIYNQELFDGTTLNDFPTADSPLFGEAWDSYLTIGATNFIDDNTQFSPDFLGPWGGSPPPVQVILGSELHEEDGAWFYFGELPPVSSLEDVEEGNKTFDILIAQFTVDAGTDIYLSSNLNWFNTDGVQFNIPFAVNTDPCPWDLDNSGHISTFDLLELFHQWGTNGPGDFDESGAVNGSDLLTLFANWGPCP